MIKAQFEPLHHWNYFKSIEREIENLSLYIEFTEDNFDTYSIELAKLIVSICIEIDALSKLLIAKKSSSSIQISSIIQYKDYFVNEYPDICKTEIGLTQHNLIFIPWADWLNKDAPEWWTAYNSTKHHRQKKFSQANLKNVLSAASALFIWVNAYYFETCIFEYRHEIGNFLANGEVLKSSIFEFKDLPYHWFELGYIPNWLCKNKN